MEHVPWVLYVTSRLKSYRFAQTEPAYVAFDRHNAIVPWPFRDTITGPLDPPGFARTRVGANLVTSCDRRIIMEQLGQRSGFNSPTAAGRHPTLAVSCAARAGGTADPASHGPPRARRIAAAPTSPL
jgi:hypothetical protein